MENQPQEYEIKKVPLDEIIDQDSPVIPQLEACYLTISHCNDILKACGIQLEPDYSEDHPFNLMDRIGK